jgi:two-component system KDP operon response regulator KdpE
MPVRSVLIVDDEEPTRDAVRLILEEAGFTVLDVPNGRAGLDVLRGRDSPLVVLLDLMMPGMSGVELLHAVATEPTLAHRDAYIIFTAARAFSAATVRFFLPRKRMFDLPKPFDLDDLVSIVEQAALLLDREAERGATEVGTPLQTPGTEDTAGRI